MHDLKSARDRQIDELERLLTNEEYDSAFPLCLQLANGGYEHAQSILGWLYRYGEGTEQNDDQAKYWFEMAAEQGSAVALWFLGLTSYEDGDTKSAIEYFEQSVEKGYAPAMVRLAAHYLHGTGVRQDKEKAFELFEKATRLGHLRAQAEYAKQLIGGYRGFSKIPRGFYLLFNFYWQLRTVDLDDPDEYRLEW